MGGNMPQYFTVSVKDSQILYFSQSILHAIVDWNDQRLELVAWDYEIKKSAPQ